MNKINNLFPLKGNKLNSLKELIKDKSLPFTGKVLVEPFLGSCSLFLNTDYDKYYLNDLNVYIYDFIRLLIEADLEVLETNYNKLLDKFYYDGEEENIKEDKKAFYYKVRDMFFEKYDNLDDLKKLSICCFLMNNSSEYKVFSKTLICGNVAHKEPFRKEIFKQFQDKKDKIILGNLDYKEFIDEVLKFESEENIVLYLDPPTNGNFTDIKQIYKQKDFMVTIQSNVKTPEIMSYYEDYNIIEIETKEDQKEVIIIKDNRYHATREFELKILLNWLKDKDYDPKIIKHYERELKNVKQK